MSIDRYQLTEQYRDASNLRIRIALHKRFSTNPRSLSRWAFDQLELPDSARVLEVGCGTGAFWAENTGRTPDGWQITLSDASPGMVREAQRRLGDSHRYRFQLADVQELPFLDKSFDAVIAFHMLYHVPDRSRTLSEITRVLASGGRLYAATNGVKHMHELAAMVRHLDPEWSHESIFPHLSNFSLENGTEQLNSWFKEVVLLGYEDTLAITEANPLVDYLLSTIPAKDLARRLLGEEFRERVSTLRDSLERELAARDAIHVAKDVGMFIASS
jgi:ubiquinone/menaquinone biosynthesis C-methylase UbiE